ncbi:unnamed protein product [Ilex paraguariensis]|uniref:Uncharacterized protein n=1 Tax=Ilex paraguariensis TaxID=185542 RepID=A0ABC8R1Y4_9AQUA
MLLYCCWFIHFYSGGCYHLAAFQKYCSRHPKACCSSLLCKALCWHGEFLFLRRLGFHVGLSSKSLKILKLKYFKTHISILFWFLFLSLCGTQILQFSVCMVNFIEFVSRRI